MKNFYRLIFTGLLVPIFTFGAEEPSSFFSDLTVEHEEASMSKLDEELSLLDEEFEDFKEELFSLEETIQKKDDVDLEVVDKHAPIFEQKDVVAMQEVAVNEEPIQFIAPEKSEAPIVSKQNTHKTGPIAVDLSQAFSGSPIIYLVLLGMSVFSLCIWLYAILSLRATAHTPRALVQNVQNKLGSNQFDDALFLCNETNSIFGKMVASGIQSRRHGLPVMIEAMKAEGKRSSVAFWQKIGLLNDIAIIAPMLGLLGTVLGMFYAFYDVNRSIESVSTLFDGLGISVGTTVAGIIVAILALILHSTAKYRLVRALTVVETQAQGVANLIDDRTSIYKG